MSDKNVELSIETHPGRPGAVWRYSGKCYACMRPCSVRSEYPELLCPSCGALIAGHIDGTIVFGGSKAPGGPQDAKVLL